MGLQLSRSAGGFDNPSDSQSEILREMARKRASDNTWNMVQSGLMAAQLAAQSAIHDQMEQVKQQNKNVLAIQQELLNREQLQQYLEEFIFQTEKVVEDFSVKSEVPASTKYFLLQSILAQVEEDGIETATIRGRDNKIAFEKAIASVHRLETILLKEPEVQEAIKWAKKREVKRVAEQQKFEHKLNQLYSQRAEIVSKQLTFTHVHAAKLLLEDMRSQSTIPVWGWLALIPVMVLAAFLVMPLVIGGIVAVVLIHSQRNELLELTNYQISIIDEKITDLESQLNQI